MTDPFDWFDNPNSPMFVPVTPGGTPCIELGAETYEQAWENLQGATSHMPYENREALVERGYDVEKWEPPND